LPGGDPTRRVLTDIAGRGDPRHRGQRAGRGGRVEVLDRLDVAELTVGPDRVEVGERVPDAGCLRVLVDRRALHRSVVLAVRLGPGDHVVAPGNPGPVQQIREVGPGVDRRGPVAVLRALDVGR